MKDNYEWESDPSFEDQAWGKMQELLDKELPVERKRRRKGLWLLPLLLLIGISIGGITMWYYLKNQTPTLGHFPIDELEKGLHTLPLEDITISTKNEVIKTENNNVLKSNTKSTQIISTSIFNQKTKNSDNQKSNKNIITTPSSTKQQKSSIIPLVIDSTIQALLEPIPAKTDKKTVAAITPSITDNTQEVLESLSNKNIPLLNIPKHAISSSSITSSTTQHSFHWGLVAGVTTNQNIEWQGFFTGMQIGYQFKPRWSIHSGLQYAQQYIYDLSYEIVVPPIVLSDPEITDEDDIGTSDPSSNGAGFTEAVVQDTTLYSSIPQQKHDFIALPINLQYQFAPRWSVNVGTQLVYRLGAINNRLQDSPITTPDIEFSNSVYDYNALKVNTPKLQKWQIQPTVGLSWNANSNLVFQLQYKVNKNWTKVNNQSFSNVELNSQTNRAMQDQVSSLEHNFQVGAHFLF